MTMMKALDLITLDEPHFTQTELAMAKSKIEMHGCVANKRHQNRAKQCRVPFYSLATVSALLLSPLASVVNGEFSSLHLGPGSADAAFERYGYCNSLGKEQEIAECFRDMTAMLMKENTAMVSTIAQLQSPAEIVEQHPLLEPMNVANWPSDDGVHLQDPPHCLSRFCQAPSSPPRAKYYRPSLSFMCSFLPLLSSSGCYHCGSSFWRCDACSSDLHFPPCPTFDIVASSFAPSFSFCLCPVLRFVTMRRCRWNFLCFFFFLYLLCCQ